MSATEQNVITAAEVETARAERKSLVRRFADRYGVDHDKLLSTLKNTAFKIKDGEVSNEQMMALLVVAEAHGLNPFTREIFAFPSQNGIVPVVSVDGWAKLVNDHPQFNGWEFEQDDKQCTCTIFRKDREHPTKITEYMQECIRQTGPWKSHPMRMLRHKALIQAARIAFSFSGIYEPDEAEAIVEAEIDVTPAKMAPVKMREAVEALNAAVASQNADAAQKVWAELGSEKQQTIWGELRSYERAAIKKLLAAVKSLPQGDDLDAWALEAIRTAKDQEALKATWTLIQDAFAEKDAEVPDTVATACDTRRGELHG